MDVVELFISNTYKYSYCGMIIWVIVCTDVSSQAASEALHSESNLRLIREMLEHLFRLLLLVCR